MSEKTNTLHEKAKILANGGIVEISGMKVSLGHEPYIFDPCFVCDMEFSSCKGNDLLDLCIECDLITGEDCFLRRIEK